MEQHPSLPAFPSIISFRSFKYSHSSNGSSTYSSAGISKPSFGPSYSSLGPIDA